MRRLPFMAALLLAGCGGQNSGDMSQSQPMQPNPPGQPSTVKFDSYAKMLVTASTCDNNTPVDTNGQNLTFAADQDTADPAATDGIMPACQAH